MKKETVKSKERENLKVLVAHPGRQHSYRVAAALANHGMLYKYVTTVYNKKDSVLMKIIEKVLWGDNKKRAARRCCSDVDDSLVMQIDEFWGLILLAVQRVDRNRRISNKLSQIISRNFQRKLAKYIINNNIKIVISYDTNSSLLFEILKEKAPDVIKIIDNAHPCRNYLYKVYNDKIESSKQFAKTYSACGYLTNKKVAKQYGYEAKLADFHIVASSFSEQASKYNGISSERILKVPYGVESNIFQPWEKNYEDGLKVLYVGEVNQRKGILQILETARDLQDYNVEFNIIGVGKEYCSELYKPYEKYVNFQGRVSLEELQMYYGISHIFVFPSMGEGFGLVIPEALSSGLPVIASRNCAGPDLIKDGYNGFLIDAGETNQLTESVMWFYNNMEKLPVMREQAIESVSALTWENYGETLVKLLNEKVKMQQRSRE